MWFAGQTGLRQQVRDTLAVRVCFTEGPSGPGAYLMAVSKGLEPTDMFNTWQSPHMGLLTHMEVPGSALFLKIVFQMTWGSH